MKESQSIWLIIMIGEWEENKKNSLCRSIKFFQKVNLKVLQLILVTILRKEPQETLKSGLKVSLKSVKENLKVLQLILVTILRKERQGTLKFDPRVNSKLVKVDLKVVRAMELTTCSGKAKPDRREPNFLTTK